MKLEGDYLFEASVPEVWSALFDPVILAAVMPGCEKLELVDGHYVGDIKVKVGPIQGKFTGRVDLTDKIEPRSYTMVVDGRGAPGFVKATAHVVLAPEGDATRVRYDTDAQIGGKIASVGQRLIEASARAIVAQSLEGLHTNIKLRAAAHREAAAKQAAVSGATEVMTEVVPSPEMASAGNEVTGVTDVMPSPPIASAQHEASGVTEPTTAPPAAAPAASVPPAGGLSAASVGSEGAWSAEATVKTDAPTYIDEAAFDAARRARRAAADAAAAPTATAPAAPA
ncbi:MAG TPA: carbon monoxide dehydrogenase subunit G, partial [Kofleriaceae bacterium]|nr:carbon monoxide dehydrogenase subunit G [Kofleriaceae bacterium]